MSIKGLALSKLSGPRVNGFMSSTVTCAASFPAYAASSPLTISVSVFIIPP